MSLYVCGDTHGQIDLAKLTSKWFKEGKSLTKNDYVLICGDCGAVWGEDSIDLYLQEWFSGKPWTTLYVDGNHENHDALDRRDVEMWNGGRIHRISDSLIHLMRGQVYEIDDRKIFTMGGATSHDKEWRTEGKSWWAREMPSMAEYDEAILNLAKNDNKVDYVFSHCAPTSIHNQIKPWYENDELTKFHDVIKDSIEFKKWFFGHYHEDKDINEKFSALYDEVIKVW